MSLSRWTAALRTPRSDALPIAVLLFSCTVWGLMWWPLKRFGAAGLEGAPLTLLAYGGVGLLALPWLWRDRAAWRPQAGLLLGLMAVGGFANSAFVQALMLGDVVRVMLLFYLSPVWAVLGGRIFLGEAVGPRRALAVGLALAGAFLVIGGTAALAQPLSLADALALLAGVAFAGNNLFARAAQRVPMASKAIAVFLGCGLASGAVCLLADAAPVWPATPALIAGVLGFGLGWVVIATVTWQYGVTHLEAGRSGVILIAELGVAVFSAVLFGAAELSLHEAAGGLLIAAAALIEALSPTQPAPPAAVPTWIRSIERHPRTPR